MKAPMKIALLAAVLAFVNCACPTSPPYPPEPPVVVFPPYDAGPLPPLETCSDGSSVPADCRLACESLAKLGCPESAPAGRTCGCVCAFAEDAGLPLNAWCIAAASTPDQIRACGTVRCLGR